MKIEYTPFTRKELTEKTPFQRKSINYYVYLNKLRSVYNLSTERATTILDNLIDHNLSLQEQLTELIQTNPEEFL